jgi:hypothetical protein
VNPAALFRNIIEAHSDESLQPELVFLEQAYDFQRYFKFNEADSHLAQMHEHREPLGE